MADLAPLTRFPFFTELSAHGSARLLAATCHVSLPPQTKVIEQGDEVSGVYLVESGSLRVYYISAEGREGTL
jgi:CRP/FNR family transcriptional regulator